MPSWANAPELLKLAQPIIEAHHPHLIGWPIRFVWRSEMRKLKGALAAATAEIVSGRFAAFVMTDEELALLEAMDEEAEPKMFWVEVARDAWEAYDAHQRLALLDHELCHCGVEENEEGPPKMKIIPHDIEEFDAIAIRHGEWDQKVWRFALALAKHTEGDGAF